MAIFEFIEGFHERAASVNDVRSSARCDDPEASIPTLVGPRCSGPVHVGVHGLALQSGTRPSSRRCDQSFKRPPLVFRSHQDESELAKVVSSVCTQARPRSAASSGW
jgi:hypothetical protein